MSLPPLTFNAWLRYPLIKQFLSEAPADASVLEIGMGEGSMGARLARRFHRYVGIEMDPVSYARAAQRFARLGRGTVLAGDASAVEPGSRFDVVCAFEVLEHIEDDDAALRTWSSFLRAGGRLILSVPAFGARFGPHDEHVGHFRRYDPQGIAELLVSTGFVDVAVRTYGVPLGYVLEKGRNVVASRRSSAATMVERTASSGRHFQPPEWSGFLTATATAPFRLLQWPFVRSRLGTGLVVAARRRS